MQSAQPYGRDKLALNRVLHDHVITGRCGIWMRVQPGFGGHDVVPDMRREGQPGGPSRSARYRHPFHPALVSVPIGAWVASLIFDIASRVVSTPAFLTAGSRWLIAIGIAGAAIAGLAGFVDLASIPERTEAYRTACAHMAINLLVIFAYAANLLWRELAASAPVVGPGMLALSAASVALLVVSGFLGGRLTFRLGVGVAGGSVQGPGSRRTRHSVPPGARRW